MVAIKLSVMVGEDRRVTIQLPDEIPVGPAELIIQAESQPEETKPNQERERLRAKLLAAGVLLTHVNVPEGARALTLEERMRIGKLPPGARPSEELIDEDRGEW